MLSSILFTVILRTIDGDSPQCFNGGMSKKKKPEVKALPTDLLKDDALDMADKYQKAMHMRFNGKKYKEIALAVGRKEQRVRCWFMRGGPLHQRYKDFCREALSVVPGLEVRSVIEKIRDEAPKSVDTITDIRDNKKVNPATRYIAAKDMLDRAGYAPVQKQANVHYVEEMSAEELDRTFQSLIDGAQKKEAPKPEELNSD